MHRHQAIEIAMQRWERSKYLFEKATKQLGIAYKVDLTLRGWEKLIKLKVWSKIESLVKN